MIIIHVGYLTCEVLDHSSKMSCKIRCLSFGHAYPTNSMSDRGTQPTHFRNLQKVL